MSTENMSRQIEEYYQENKQSYEYFLEKIDFVNTVEKAVRAAIPFSNIYMTGSTLNGVGSRTSDVDSVLVDVQSIFYDLEPEETANEDPHKKSRQEARLLKLTRSLRCCKFFGDAKMSVSRFMTVLKFEDPLTKLECDLNLNDVSPIANTLLLFMYGNIDRRFRPLSMIVKRWASVMGVHNTTNSMNYPSSFPYNAMLIFFMQKEKMLPSLNTLMQKYNFHVTGIAGQNMNTTPQALYGLLHLQIPFNDLYEEQREETKRLNLFELFMAYMAFYAKIFCKQGPFDKVISLKEGELLDFTRKQRIDLGFSFIYVEDPMTGSNVTRCINKAAWTRMGKAFRVTYTQLEQADWTNMNLLDTFPALCAEIGGLPPKRGGSPSPGVSPKVSPRVVPPVFSQTAAQKAEIYGHVPSTNREHPGVHASRAFGGGPLTPSTPPPPQPISSYGQMTTPQSPTTRLPQHDDYERMLSGMSNLKTSPGHQSFSPQSQSPAGHHQGRHRKSHQSYQQHSQSPAGHQRFSPQSQNPAGQHQGHHRQSHQGHSNYRDQGQDQRNFRGNDGGEGQLGYRDRDQGHGQRTFRRNGGQGQSGYRDRDQGHGQSYYRGNHGRHY